MKDFLTFFYNFKELNQITNQQFEYVLVILFRAIKIEPDLMMPTVGLYEDGNLYLSWNPLIINKTLTIEIDKHGNIIWFFMNNNTGDYDGSEKSITNTPFSVVPFHLIATLCQFRKSDDCIEIPTEMLEAMDKEADEYEKRLQELSKEEENDWIYAE